MRRVERPAAEGEWGRLDTRYGEIGVSFALSC